MTKEFHIISSGVSILTNAMRKGVIPQNKKIGDEGYWEAVLSDTSMIKNLISFVKQDYFGSSAELNTFLRVVKDKDPKNVEVYLFGTNTNSNELCRMIIESVLNELGYNLHNAYEVSGYFWEASKYDEKYAKDEFQRGISKLLDRLIHLARKKKKEGYEIYFNPTGGLKSHVITSALAGYILDAQVYYMNEEFNDVVFLPKLIYLPKGKEIDILMFLKDKNFISGKDAVELFNKNPDEMERLTIYGLIDIETDDTNKVYRIKITSKGKLITEKLQ